MASREFLCSTFGFHSASLVMLRAALRWSSVPPRREQNHLRANFGVSLRFTLSLKVIDFCVARLFYIRCI